MGENQFLSDLEKLKKELKESVKRAMNIPCYNAIGESNIIKAKLYRFIRDNKYNSKNTCIIIACEQTLLKLLDTDEVICDGYINKRCALALGKMDYIGEVLPLIVLIEQEICKEKGIESIKFQDVDIIKLLIKREFKYCDPDKLIEHPYFLKKSSLLQFIYSEIDEIKASIKSKQSQRTNKAHSVYEKPGGTDR